MLTKIVSAVAGASARRPKLTVALWLAFVVACVGSGAIFATRSLSDADSGVGSSARADHRMRSAGLAEAPSESVMVRAADASSARDAAGALVASLRRSGDVASVTRVATAQAGRAVLVRATLRGTSEGEDARAKEVQRRVAAVHRTHPGAQFAQSGAGSFDSAISAVVKQDLGRAELISLPVTLLILVIAFGAFVAACVPLLLGITSVAAALGALGLVSQITPISDPTSTVLVLIGLAVGVDYSLFYIRREREERRAGRSATAALSAASASVGRAIVVAGLSVTVAIAGLLATGMAVFASMALGTMLVVLIAVLGSVTVLPAMLALLGDRVERGRIRVPRHGGRGVWGRVGGIVTRHPLAALVTSVGLLGSLALPAVHMKPADAGVGALPADIPVVQATRQIERTFGAAPETATIVAKAAPRPQLQRLAQRARTASGGHGETSVRVRGDVASIAIPMPGGDRGASDAAVTRVRRMLPAGAELTGDDASSKDFTDRLHVVTPIVVGLVMLLAFSLLMATFRSTKLAAGVIALNLLSVGAGYGVMTLVFQGHWAEGLLGFTSTGSIANYLPLLCFVILFGLSMDYTVLVLERIREARQAGMDARTATAEGIAATGSTVTSAAIVMVAVFAIFATLRLLELKQLGIGLSAAVLVDATVVRGLALPALTALLGERGWPVATAHGRSRARDDRRRAALAPTGHHGGR